MRFAAGSVRDIPVRALRLCGLTWTGQFLWFSEAVSNQIMALDPYAGSIEHRVPCPGVKADLTTADGYLIQVAGADRALRVIDPVAGCVVDERPNPRPGSTLAGVEATRHGLWLGYDNPGLIELRDRRTLELIESYHIRHPMAGLTVSDNYAVYADRDAGNLNLFDLDTGRDVASYSVAGQPTGVTWDGTRIWYCDYATLQLRAIEIPGITKG
jgi:hypothetical protein